MTALEQHTALDHMMSRWAVITRGLFSQAPVRELAQFVIRQPNDEQQPPFWELLENWKAAGMDCEKPITDLMAWSWERVQAEQGKAQGGAV